MRYIYIVLMTILLTGQVMGEAVVNGGWSITGNGDGSSQGANEISYTTGDPSATLGITSSSSVYGPGTFSRTLTGSHSLKIGLAGFNISLGYDGMVSSSVSLDSQGSASSSAYVGATAAGISTGNGTYDIFGAADLSTEGYLNGKGTIEASAKRFLKLHCGQNWDAIRGLWRCLRKVQPEAAGASI